MHNNARVEHKISQVGKQAKKVKTVHRSFFLNLPGRATLAVELSDMQDVYANIVRKLSDKRRQLTMSRRR